MNSKYRKREHKIESIEDDESLKDSKPLVSVLIPTYNSEELVGRCIESALNQTLSNIEIIVIDDASKDATQSIIKSYEKKDKRVKTIFKKKNSGVGSSRNMGIKKAKGKFIGFIDADDYIDPGWFQYLYENSKGKDLVRGIRVIHNFSEEYTKSTAKPYGCIIPSIIRKSFLDKHKLKFPEVRKFEDSTFNRQLKNLKPRTEFLPDNGIYYHYVKREGSLSDYTNPNHNTTTTTTTATATATTTIETTINSSSHNTTINIDEIEDESFQNDIVTITSSSQDGSSLLNSSSSSQEGSDFTKIVIVVSIIVTIALVVYTMVVKKKNFELFDKLKEKNQGIYEKLKNSRTLSKTEMDEQMDYNENDRLLKEMV